MFTSNFLVNLKYKENKLLIFIVFFLFLLISLVLFTRYILTSNVKTGINVNKTKIIKVNIVPDALKIAKSTLEWVDKQKDVRGIYTHAALCSIENPDVCTPSVMDNRSEIDVLWGRYKYFNTTKDQDELNKLINDITQYSNEVKIIQNNSWNCKLMYDLWNSDIFTVDQKTKIRDVCFKSTYELAISPIILVKVDESRLDIKIIDQNIKNKISDILLDKNSDFNLEYKDTLENKLNNYKYPFHTSDYLSRYKWEKNKKDLTFAYMFFDISLEDYIQNKNAILPYQKCATGVAAVSFFDLINDPDYIAVAKKILFEDTKNLVPDQQSVAICSYLANDLYTTTKNNEYLNKKNEILRGFIKTNFDLDGYSGKLKGDGGFYTKGGDSYIKEVVSNSLLLGLLSDNHE